MEENNQVDSAAPAQEALNEPASNETPQAPAEQTGAPESIPYNRFQEVNTEKNQLKKQLAIALQNNNQNEQIMQSLDKINNPPQAYDADADLDKFSENPREFLNQYTSSIKQEIVQEQQEKQQAMVQQESAFNGAIAQHSNVANSTEAQQMVVNIAQSLAGSGRFTSWNDVYAESVRQVASIAGQPVTPTVPTTAEGGSLNIPTGDSSLQAQYEQAMSNKDVKQMLVLSAKMKRQT